MYEVLLHAKGLRLVDENGQLQTGGCYMWQAVEATDEAEAVARAKTELLRDSLFADELWNESIDEISIEVDEVRDKGPDANRTAFSPVFYIEDD